MPLEIIDVTNANFVIVGHRAFGTEEELKNLVDYADAPISTPQAIAPDGSRTFSIDRERVRITQRPDGNSMVTRDYPETPADLDYFAKIVELAVEELRSTPELRTFGFNIEALCRQDSGLASATYMVERFFDVSRLSEMAVHGFFSAIWQFGFADEERQWTFHLRPLDNISGGPNLQVNVNSHHENQTLPDQTMIKRRLTETWNFLPKFVERLERAS